MKLSKSLLKRFLRWVILGAVLFFLAKVLHRHWQEVSAVRVEATGWACLAIAVGLTLLSHTYAGWVWSRILQKDFRQSVRTSPLIQAYLQTNIGKYLPGNIWHYYGRISAAQRSGASLETATVSVLLEPLLMSSAALIVALLSGQVLAARYGWPVLIAQWGFLAVILGLIHPKILNLAIRRLANLKQKAATPSHLSTLNHYPVKALLGNLMFLILRSSGFLMIFLAFSSFNLEQVLLLLSAFSTAWMLGVIVPGVPGGIGIFEATMIALLGSLFPPSTLIAVVAFYRLVSVSSEAIGSILGWLDQKLTISPKASDFPIT